MEESKLLILVEAKTKVKAEGDEEEELPYIVSAEQFQKLGKSLKPASMSTDELFDPDASDALKKPLRVRYLFHLFSLI